MAGWSAEVFCEDWIDSRNWREDLGMYHSLDGANSLLLENISREEEEECEDRDWWVLAGSIDRASANLPTVEEMATEI